MNEYIRYQTHEIGNLFGMNFLSIMLGYFRKILVDFICFYLTSPLTLKFYSDFY